MRNSHLPDALLSAQNLASQLRFSLHSRAFGCNDAATTQSGSVDPGSGVDDLVDRAGELH
jgi:hypothetical protein